MLERIVPNGVRPALEVEDWRVEVVISAAVLDFQFELRLQCHIYPNASR
jgi:hypothetical protein